MIGAGTELERANADDENAVRVELMSERAVNLRVGYALLGVISSTGPRGKKVEKNFWTVELAVLILGVVPGWALHNSGEGSMQELLLSMHPLPCRSPGHIVRAKLPATPYKTGQPELSETGQDGVVLRR